MKKNISILFLCLFLNCTKKQESINTKVGIIDSTTTQKDTLIIPLQDSSEIAILKNELSDGWYRLEKVGIKKKKDETENSLGHQIKQTVIFMRFRLSCPCTDFDICTFLVVFIGRISLYVCWVQSRFCCCSPMARRACFPEQTSNPMPITRVVILK